MPRSTIECLHYILAEVQYLLAQSEGLNRDAFIEDETLKRVFVRSLEIIGEATKQVSDGISQKYGHIEWRSMAGMRDRLIHGYFSVDYDNVVHNKLPALQEELEHIIQAERERDV